MSIPANWNGSEWGRRSDAHRRVMEFLTLDVQDNHDYIKHLHNQIKALETGTISDCICSGNAYYLRLSPQTVTIENLIVDDDPIETISLHEFKEAILGWQENFDD
ncbi:hypothetical protein [Sodalinema gerasimenkoae]|uniref:hypothetical protein n=1 Tax=Sodalinema gerasimenkoae TaxID=2862348 RepID=UPI001357985F|nr:hypothetical protein [Sodalinema gerasimenkoae]